MFRLLSFVDYVVYCGIELTGLGFLRVLVTGVDQSLESVISG